MNDPTTRDPGPPGSPRRPYAKPELEEVQLILEESVLATCKEPSNCPGNLQHPDLS